MGSQSYRYVLAILILVAFYQINQTTILRATPKQAVPVEAAYQDMLLFQNQLYEQLKLRDARTFVDTLPVIIPPAVPVNVPVNVPAAIEIDSSTKQPKELSSFQSKEKVERIKSVQSNRYVPMLESLKDVPSGGQLLGNASAAPSMRDLIVFPHIPKTGGGSFYNTLRWLTAKGRNKPRYRPPSLSNLCVYGGFICPLSLSLSYRWYPDLTGGSASFSDVGCGLKQGSAHCDVWELEGCLTARYNRKKSTHKSFTLKY